jgi:hypothetical protein
MLSIFRGLICAGVIAYCAARPLLAQEPGGGDQSQDRHLRNECCRAGQILQTAQPAPHYEWAIGTISRCIETGGEVLASVWVRPPTDSSSLNSLFRASYRLRDARVTEAAITTASNGSLPQLVRLNAIRVLVGHAVPRFLMSLTELPPDLRPGVYETIGSVSHVVAYEGARPIDSETLDNILDTLSRLRSDPDPRIASAAAYVFPEVSYRLRGTP